MSKLREAAQQALEAMDYMLRNGEWYQAHERADALRAALAEPVQEPYPNSHQRKPLTVDQIYEMYSEPRSDAEMVEFARAIEAAHGIGV